MNMEIDDDTPAFVMDAPDGVPQSNKFKGKQFFVRECYPQFYDLVSARLREDGVDFVSVTGTPGIGKSLFYLYFFIKYRAENPDTKVLTAAFSKKRKLISCRVWSSLNDIRDNGEPDFVEYDQIPKILKVPLHLYDGPPEVVPSSSKMVAFTSPSKSWLRGMSKQEGHKRLYMPNWEPLELDAANQALELGLTDADLLKRRALFGGTARYTLTRDQEFMDTGVDGVESALNTIKDVLDVQRCFEGTADEEKVVHRLMHYEVDEAKVWKARLVPASKEVAAMIHGKLRESLDSQRQQLMLWLESAGKASTFYGWLLENFVHEQLLKGGTFKMASIDNQQRDTHQLVLEPTVGTYNRFKLRVPLQEALLRDYRMPDSSKAQSFDSYYVSGEEIVIFQITRNMTHGIDLEGIIHLLDFLNSTQTVQTNPNHAKIVFVVPMELQRKFPRQRVTKDPIFEGMTMDQIRACDCTMVSGIKNATKKKLNERGINTVGELLDANNTDRIKFVQFVVNKFLRDLVKFANAKFVTLMPQFVVGVDCSSQLSISVNG